MFNIFISKIKYNYNYNSHKIVNYLKHKAPYNNKIDEQFSSVR